MPQRSSASTAGRAALRSATWDSSWPERVNRYTLSTPSPDGPLPTVVHEHERHRLELEFLPDPLRDLIFIGYRLDGAGRRVYPLLAPCSHERGLRRGLRRLDGPTDRVARARGGWRQVRDLSSPFRVSMGG